MKATTRTVLQFSVFYLNVFQETNFSHYYFLHSSVNINDTYMHINKI